MNKYILLCLLLITSNSIAQVNTEAYRQDKKKLGLYHSLSLYFSSISGNSSFSSHKLNYRGDYIAQSYNSFFIYENQQRKTPSKTIANKGFSHLRLTKSFHSRFDWEFFLQNEFNDFTLLKNRNLLGLSIRKTALSFANHSFLVSSGLMLEEEDLSSGKTSRSIRSTNYLIYKYSSPEKLKIIITSYVQPKLSEFANYRVLSDASVYYALTKHMYLTSGVNFRYNSEPPNNVKSYDLELNQGLSFLF
ncbi:hypothetical protein DID78_00670 [Candidatus Marinamargulisbacteria bacterium SCGC AG-343-D04]|nr:hypothetical protein DID78_00670 [Candidatus Marinamargulisbacteria bacterium SCGC AG-343-D04]